MSDMRGRVIRGAGLAGAGFALSRIITFGGYIAIAGLISPKEAGVFAAGSIVAGLGTLFVESGMLSAVIQWRGDVDEAASTAFAATLASGVALTALAAVTAPLVGMFFDSDRIGDIALGCSGFLLLRALQVVPDALLQRRFSFLRRVAVDPIGAVAFVAVAVVACASGMGAWGLVLGTYAIYAVQVVTAWGFVRWRPSLKQMSMATWRRLAGFGRHVVASELVRQVVVHLDSLLLGRFAGVAPLGQYNYGLRLAGQTSAGFVSIAAYVLFPAFARAAEEPERLRRSFVESTALAAVLMFPLSLVLIPLGDELALLAFGPEWSGAGNVIKALCLTGIGWTGGSLASEALKSVGHPELITRMHLVTLGASVVLMPALLWADETGIALAVSLAATAQGAYGLARAAPLMGLRLGELLRPLGAILAAAAVGLAAAGALDLLVFDAHTSRAGAVAPILAEGAALLVFYVVALRVLAPAEVRRVTGLAGHLRRRPAVEA